MKITLLQTDPVWADPGASRSRAESLIREQPETDLLVLPEMFATGFVTEPEGVAEGEDSESLRWMKRLARERHCALAGSLAVQLDTPAGGYRNRFYFVFPDGTEWHYDKRHLFTYGGEHLHYTSGAERVIVDYRGVRILLQVCYDLRFPVFSRNRLVDGRPDYDLILYIASWPVQRIGAWDSLLKARAIENLCYVAGVNRAGSDPANAYPGHSVLVDPYGKILSACKENAVEAVTCECDWMLLDELRSRFPALQDADVQFGQ